MKAGKVSAPTKMWTPVVIAKGGPVLEARSATVGVRTTQTELDRTGRRSVHAVKVTRWRQVRVFGSSPRAMLPISLRPGLLVRRLGVSENALSGCGEEGAQLVGLQAGKPD